MCLAVPGELLELTCAEPLQRRGRVRFGGVVREVNLTCTPEARPGDYVLVHVGLALSVIDPREAARTLEYLAGLGEGAP